MQPALNIMVKAARRASQIINRASQDTEHLQITAKQQRDFVTEVDKAAEKAIIEILSESYPDYGILAEESGSSAGKDSDFQWIIDPLDGTTNFIHGFPQYAISIALAHRGQPVQGVVYDTVRNELFTASKGSGAFLNDRRIRVSKCERLEHSLIGTGFPFKELGHLDAYLNIFRELTAQTSGIRRPGAASLDLCYVACGRLDGFWEFGLCPWDLAAGCLLILEAGGLIGDLSDGDAYLKSGNLFAGTPRIFTQMERIVRKHTAPGPSDGRA